MRKVLPKEKIGHLWIHQTQDEARTPTGNFYFTGPTLYSYGSHFVCGHILPSEHYGRTVLVNSGRYSMTTGRHMDIMRHAIPSAFRKVRVPGLSSNTVYGIGRDGAGRIVERLLNAFGGLVDDAATHRNIRAATRAGILSTAFDVLADARFLLDCDARRADLSADVRKAARSQLRKLPKPEDVPGAYLSHESNADARAACEAFAMKVRRDAYRVQLARHVADHARLVAVAVAYDSTPETADVVPSYSRDAADALSRLSDAEETAKQAAHAAKLGGRKAPRLSIPAGLRERLTQRKAREERGRNIAAYGANIVAIAETPATDWRHVQAIGRLSSLAADLAPLDTEAQRAQRAADIATMKDEAEAAKPARAAIVARLALDAMAAGKLDEARRRAGDLERIGGPEHSETWARVYDWATQEEQARHAAAIAAWRDGSSDYCPRLGSGALLRLSGDVIETSQGADVPVSVAPMVWQAANACRDANAPHVFDEPPQLGHFRLDRIDANGDIHAGCHFIAFTELQVIARALNY